MRVARKRTVALGLGWVLVACTPEPEPEPPEPEVPPDVEYCASVDGWPEELAQFEVDVVAELNLRRGEGAMCGEDSFEPAEPLTMNAALRCASRKHALDMGEQGYFSNLDPDMLDFFARAELAQYEGTPLSQNIGANHHTPEQLVTALMGNTELCRHAMDPAADEIGVGYSVADDGWIYWVQVFGAS